MRVLGIDTATPRVTVAVAEVDADGGARTVVEHCDAATNRHAELLAPLVARALHDARISPADLDAIAVGIGPGPFTGLRVGVVTAAAMSDALAVPAYAACSLDVIARAHVGGDSDVLVLTDARRRQVYWARYAAGGTRLDGPEVGDAGALAERFRGEVARVVGSGAVLWRDALAGFDVVDDDPWPSAATLCALVAPRVAARAPADVLEPAYLRRPDARPPGPPKKVTPA